MMGISRFTVTGLATLAILAALAAYASASALAAPPTIQYTSASTSTVNATVAVTFAPEEEVATCEFQYVVAEHYLASAPNPYEAGATQACSPPTSGLSGQESGIVKLENLPPSTTYHFRFFLKNSSGTVHSEDSTFETAPEVLAVVESESASPFAFSGVTLKAQINPELSNTTYQFQYGPTSAYASGTVPISPGLIPGAFFEYFSESVNYDVIGLSGNTTYHYRVVATNPTGTTYGEDKTFTTPAPPPGVVTGAASDITQTDARVTGAVDPEGLETSYYYQYGPTTEYGQVTPALPGTGVGSGSSPVSAPAFIQPLTPGETYHYRLVASNEDGTSYGQDQVLITVADEPPVASTGAANGVSVETATISATIDPHGNSAVYSFEYGTTTAYGTQTFGTAPLDRGVQTVTLALRGLQAGTTYHYRIVASNPGGASVGEDETFTTPPIASPILAPTPPPLIGIPSIAFPRGAAVKPVSKALTKAQRLAAALKACAGKPKSERAACRRRARKKYRTS
jgi:hypothetical protein